MLNLVIRKCSESFGWKVLLECCCWEVAVPHRTAMPIKDSCLFWPESLPFPLFKLSFWYLWNKWGVVPPSYMFYLSLSLSLLIPFSVAFICWMYWYPETGIACHSEGMFVSNALELARSFFACWICDDPLGFAVPQGSKYRANGLLHPSTGLWTQAKPTSRDDYGGSSVTSDSSVGICT